MRLRSAHSVEAEALAEVQAAAFEAPWSAADIRVLMTGSGAFALAAEQADGALAGFILCRAIAGEAEVLTLAVSPAHRRKGIGLALTEAAAGLAATDAAAMFLEVAQDNPGALALYERAGFARVGKRARYYSGRMGEAADAIIMRRALNTSSRAP